MSAAATTPPTDTRPRTTTPRRTRSFVRSSLARTGAGATSTRLRSSSTGSAARPASRRPRFCSNSESRRAESRGFAGSSTCELGARGGGDVGVRVGVTADSPAALGRLRQQHPRALAKARIAGGICNDVGELLDDTELLVAVEHSHRSEYLDSHVVALPRDVRDRAASI